MLNWQKFWIDLAEKARKVLEKTIEEGVIFDFDVSGHAVSEYRRRQKDANESSQMFTLQLIGSEAFNEYLYERGAKSELLKLYGAINKIDGCIDFNAFDDYLTIIKNIIDQKNFPITLKNRLARLIGSIQEFKNSFHNNCLYQYQKNVSRAIDDQIQSSLTMLAQVQPSTTSAEIVVSRDRADDHRDKISQAFTSTKNLFQDENLKIAQRYVSHVDKKKDAVLDRKKSVFKDIKALFSSSSTGDIDANTIETELRKLYKLPDSKSDFSVAATAYAKYYWWHPSQKQKLLAQYVAASEETSEKVRLDVKIEFETMLTRCATEAPKNKDEYIDFQQRVLALEKEHSTDNYNVSKKWNENYIKNIKAALALLYEDKSYSATSTSILKKASATNFFGGLWESKEYKTVEKLLTAVDHIPADQKNIAVHMNALRDILLVKRSFKDNKESQAAFSALEASIQHEWIDDVVKLIETQDNAVDAEKNRIEKEKNFYVAHTGIPANIVRSQEGCDFFITQLFKENAKYDIASVSETIKERPEFTIGNPNAYFIFVLLNIEWLRIKDQRPPYKEALKALIQDLFVSGDHSKSLQALRDAEGVPAFLTQFLPDKLTLTMTKESEMGAQVTQDLMPVLQEKIDAMTEEELKAYAVERSRYIRNGDLFTTTNVVNTAKSLLTSGFSLFSASSPVAPKTPHKSTEKFLEENNKSSSNSVRFIHAMWNRYLSTNAGKELFDLNKHPDSDNGWKNLRQQYTKVLDVLGAVINETGTLFNMQLIMPVLSSGQKMDGSLGRLIAETKNVFPTVCVDFVPVIASENTIKPISNELLAGYCRMPKHEQNKVFLSAVVKESDATTAASGVRPGQDG